MNLTPKEEERLLTFTAAELARRRKDRGVPLNHPEAVAYISDWCVERARDGRSVAEVRAGASRLLGREDVMAGVPEMIDMIQVEPVFPDGTKLVTVHDPIRSDSVGTADGDGEAASETESTTDGGTATSGENASDATAPAETPEER